MSLFIAIVSHGHDDLIADNDELKRLASCIDCEVVIIDNLGSGSLKKLSELCGYHYQESDSPAGFGANNNAVFLHCINLLKAKPNDFFCLVNPDVIIDPDVLLSFVEELIDKKVDFATLNLAQDFSGTRPDLNIKRFPSMLDFAKGLLFGVNPAAYDKLAFSEPTPVDWASGAFLLFRVDLYEKLGGFDEQFFMYLEDVDICRRAQEQLGERLWYFPQFKAVHLCQQANKQLFSRHFWWFVTSMIRYFWKYRFRTRPREAR